MGDLLSRDQILGADDVEFADVAVPEWGGTVRVRGLTGAERDEYETEITRIRGSSVEMRLQNARAKLVVRACIDSTGDRLFTDADVAALGKKSAKALNRVWNIARRLSGLSAEDVEELVQDFGETPDGGPGSASLSPSGEPSPSSSEDPPPHAS